MFCETLEISMLVNSVLATFVTTKFHSKVTKIVKAIDSVKLVIVCVF